MDIHAPERISGDRLEGMVRSHTGLVEYRPRHNQIVGGHNVEGRGDDWKRGRIRVRSWAGERRGPGGFALGEEERDDDEAVHDEFRRNFISLKKGRRL